MYVVRKSDTCVIKSVRTTSISARICTAQIFFSDSVITQMDCVQAVAAVILKCFNITMWCQIDLSCMVIFFDKECVRCQCEYDLVSSLVLLIN